MVLVGSNVGGGMLLLRGNFVGILQSIVSIQDITGNEWQVCENLVFSESTHFAVVLYSGSFVHIVKYKSEQIL